MLERDDFKKRYAAERPIAIHEFLYPLAQAYDSVFLEADFELGGTDQLFNLLVGRDIMRAYDLEPQVVLTTPLLEGLDGVEKMSKSLDNYVGVTDAPEDMFGKLMSISDELMWKYYELLTDVSVKEIEALRSSGDPMSAKLDLAGRILEDFHSADDAERARRHFDAVVRNKDVPDDVPEHRVAGPIAVSKLIADAGLAGSRSEARRLIRQGAVSLGAEKIADDVELDGTDDRILKVGKRRYLRVVAD